MKNHLVSFKDVDWTVPAAGVRYKAFIENSKKVRLVEFSEGLVEPDWCTKGHAGVVVDGECRIDFNGTVEEFRKGDIIYIPQGDNDKHMVRMEKGEWVQLLLFEDI